MLKRVLPALVTVILHGAVPAASAARGRPAVRPIPRISRVLLVSIDGLRPDALLRAKAPVIQSLMARGSFSMWARTTAAAVTLPSHTSMLTGVPPSKHGIDWNSTLPLGHQVYPAWPTLFRLARENGYTSAMVAGKSKFVTLAEPGTLDWSYVPTASVITDGAVADTVVRWVERFAPGVFFVHLPGVDTAGHAKGWGSKEQLEAIATADRCVGRILDALKARGILDSTFILVTSDHGGAGTSHGPDDPRSRTIPWIAAGPGVRAGLDLTAKDALEIKTEDTFATLCYVLGITPSRPVDGRPVMQIFRNARESVLRQ